MTWTKLGDEFLPESADLTDGEFRTHIEALVWSSWRMLDLYVPKNEVRRFARSTDPEGDIDGLIVKGWWEDRGNCWYIGVRFAEWQLERSVTQKRRDQAALRKRRQRMHEAGDHSLCLKCPNVTRDGTRDPGRVGTGRGALRPKVKSTSSVAISQNPRDHNGSVNRAGQAQLFSTEPSLQSPATGGNARARSEP